MAGEVNWRSKVVEALLLLVAVAVVARVVCGLLGPLLPSLLVLFVLGACCFGFSRAARQSLKTGSLVGYRQFLLTHVNDCEISEIRGGRQPDWRFDVARPGRV